MAHDTADFTWEIYQAGYTDTAARRPTLDGNAVATLIATDASTVYTLGLGIDITFTDDGGVFTAGKVFEVNLLSDSLELPVTSATHDLLADSPSVVTLEVKGDEFNYSGPGTISGSTGVTAGTHTSGGRYFHETDAVYSITATITGVRYPCRAAYTNSSRCF